MFVVATKVVYKSSNGTSLGSTTVTYAYGTTNTISAPAYSGYATPSSQSVKWDSTSAKTITFTYKPNSVSTSQTVCTGTWCSSPTITYSVALSYQNRTSSSVQIKVDWTNTIKANGYYGYAQYYYPNVGGVHGSTYTIDSSSAWSSQSSSARSKTGSTGWITVPVSATQTSVSFAADWWRQSGYKSSVSGTFYIPAY